MKRLGQSTVRLAAAALLSQNRSLKLGDGGASDGGHQDRNGTAPAEAVGKSDWSSLAPGSGSSASVPISTSGPSSEIDLQYDHGPRRESGLWSVGDVQDPERGTVDFRRIDDIESDIASDREGRDNALVLQSDERRWKNKLMFEYKFKKTPKHLTWAEFGKEISCIDCVIELDEHRPEEIFTMTWFYVDKQRSIRDVVWSARNDVAVSEAFTDFLAAIGSCMGRPDVHRTLRFDDGVGTTREINLRKNSRYTSEIVIAFRPPTTYNTYERKGERDELKQAMEEQGLSTWGFHPDLMSPEYLDLEDPEGTYHVTLSAHAFGFVMLQALERLLSKPMDAYYRPSQQLSRVKVRRSEDIGISKAVAGWLGADEMIYPHYTPIEAIQDHYLGNDSPFTLVSIINKLREMCYLKRKNPEFHSWLSVRKYETTIALRNTSAKLLGAGASTLFLPKGHNSTINQLLPKSQQRNVKAKFSLNAMLSLPDETRKLDEFKQITGHQRITGNTTGSTTSGSTSSSASSTAPAAAENGTMTNSGKN